MAIKHKYLAPDVADGPNDGRIQPSHFRDDHDAGPVVEALSELTGFSSNSLVYFSDDGTPSLIPISSVAKQALAASPGSAIATLLGCAPLDSPEFSGNALAPDIAGTTDSSRRMATTAFVQAVRALLAPLNSPQFTGEPLAPTALPGDNSSKIANTAFVAAALAALVNSSPGTLDTLKELADAIGDDPNFSVTIMAALALRLRADAAQSFNSTQKSQLAANGGLPRIIKIRRIIASGTYVADANLVFAKAFAQGAGGGGGGTSNSPANFGTGGGGGGSGSCSIKILTPADIGVGLSVSIGAAGTAGPASDTAGGNGGDTSIGALCIGKGGGGGPGSGSRAAGAGGVAGTGDSFRLGRNGDVGQNFGSSASGSRGADAEFGTGGRPVNISGAGGAATGYGSGGAGGISFNGSGAFGGGAGAPGYAEIEEYCTQ